MISTPRRANLAYDEEIKANLRIDQIIWSLGVRTKERAAQFGLPGPWESVLVQLANPRSRILTGEAEVTVGPGLRIISPNSYSGLRSIKAGLYERAVAQLFWTLARPGMTIVDIGANIGYYSILASRLVGGTGKVFSFEPDPSAYGYLERNIKLNQCTNVEIDMHAIRESNSAAWFHPDPGLAEGYVSGSFQETGIQIDTTSLDEYFGSRGWPHVDIVKIDVEGSELSILEGMKSLSRRNMQMRLVMEYSPRILARARVSRQELATVLQEIGFHRGSIIERNMRSFPIKGGLPRTQTTYNLLIDRRT